MTDAQRIWDEEERLLLAAGRADVPPQGSTAGVLAALGLPNPVGPGGGEEAPVSGLSPIPAPVAPSAGAAPVSGIFARPLTWVGMGGVLLALVPAAMMLGGETEEGTVAPSEFVAQPAPVTDSLAGEAPQRPAEVEASPTLEDALLPEEVPEEDTAAPIVAPTAPGHEKSAARPSLAEELAVIKQAQSSLNAGDLGAAEAALASHAKKFNPPRLSSEARVLRVEILVKRGQMTEARQLAAPLMQQNSPYRARMETLLSSP